MVLADQADERDANVEKARAQASDPIEARFGRRIEHAIARQRSHSLGVVSRPGRLHLGSYDARLLVLKVLAGRSR